MELVEYEQNGASAVFYIRGEGGDRHRITGGLHEKKLGRWVYPAYAPVGIQVYEDLIKVYPKAKFSPEAEAQVERLLAVASNVANRVLPPVTLPVTPFDHQLEGLAYLYHNPRWALLWEPGVGKTKVLCDLKLLTGRRMLVLAPRVVVSTWLREVDFHSKGALKAVAIEGSPKQKKQIIRDHKKYDVLVCTYGTARTMFEPDIGKKTRDILAASGRFDCRAAAEVLAKVADPDRQVQLAQAWVSGRPLVEVEATIGPQEPSWLSDVDYDIIVADESHNIKQRDSQQTKAALELAKKAERRYILSGTPALGDPRHLYSQLRFLAPSLMPEDWYSFQEKFLVTAPHNKHIVIGFRNLHLINQRVDRVAIRKRKDECLDLPPRHVIDVKVQPSTAQLRMYNELISTMQADLATYIQTGGAEGMLQAQNAAVRLNKLSQILSGFVYTTEDPVVGAVREVKRLPDNPKLKALSEQLETILEDPSHKVIVWCVYTPEIDEISARLSSENVKHVVLDGRTSGRAGNLLKEFETDAECRVLVGQIGSGVGFTANAAAYTIYYSLDWSLDKYLQSIDRNYRAGQTKKVTVYRLLCDGTVDTLKARALDNKKDISAVMTQKLACVTCANNDHCSKNDIKLFDKQCMYRRSVTRVVAKAELLQEEDDESSAGDK